MRTNEEARQYFKDKGFTYADIDYARLNELQNFLAHELYAYRHSGDAHAKDMGMHVRKPLKKHSKVLKRTGLQYAYFKVDGSYFENREAISFNRDGFIGFGGEFSSVNVQPMLKAFCAWCDFMEKGHI